MKYQTRPWTTAERTWASVLAVLLLTMTAASLWAWTERSAAIRSAQRTTDLDCLAHNVYYEARGEPLAGQYAVAEVTMNRVASPSFPNSVCAVVYQRGAFSWTYAKEMPAPYGYEWRRARAVAGTIYDSMETPLVDGALFYHATYIAPDWAPTRSQVALIGRHLFYR